jgi:hypothetical protein
LSHVAFGRRVKRRLCSSPALGETIRKRLGGG